MSPLYFVACFTSTALMPSRLAQTNPKLNIIKDAVPSGGARRAPFIVLKDVSLHVVSSLDASVKVAAESVFSSKKDILHPFHKNPITRSFILSQYSHKQQAISATIRAHQKTGDGKIMLQAETLDPLFG